jgi:peptidyl-tRNA hydrolase
LAALDKRKTPNPVVHNAANCVENVEDLNERKPQHYVLPLSKKCSQISKCKKTGSSKITSAAQTSSELLKPHDIRV